MAKPRIFVSSTFYDLKYIRADLERFIHSMGYEPILNEYGHIPYGSTERLEEYCYKEVELCDMLIGIIGGRFGSQSASSDQSITQTEIETALRDGKQVYIFIEKSVNSEYYTYQANKDNTEIASKIKYANTNDPRIFEYIEKIRNLTHNNTIHTFENVDEICRFLKEQWAGLFKSFLQNQAKYKFTNTLDEIKSTASTLQNMVDYLSSQNEESKNAIKDILLSNHPAMDAVREILGLKAKLYFSNIAELNDCFYQFNYRKEENSSIIHHIFMRTRKNTAYELNMTIKEISLKTEIFDKIVEDLKNEKIIIYYKKSLNDLKLAILNRKIFDNEGKLISLNHKSWKKDNIRAIQLDGKFKIGNLNSKFSIPSDISKEDLMKAYEEVTWDCTDSDNLPDN